MNLKEKAKGLKRDIPAVFLALKKRETPWYAKVIAFLTVGYALSPLDLIPDLIPVLGYLDDLLILPLMVAFTIRLIPKEVMKGCREEAVTLWVSGKPKKWYYALPVVLLWLLLLGFLLRKLR
ncbi:DUF1232 domain-containing protein [Proteiniclasticum sp. BAD-10]|uniref:DUF1232 domain-containing protein n=1 Tax=Proteiniclasticum sediminis TaxID=2804028 RepID=A0A941CRY3_9CLOT|nr:YkvA family protein [Proteiniclasticum sediminis]MBR0577014.1 DUF1232 domain-containing protein [Proteiniclasticum sediminis]